jgi:hypothetical protein
MKKIDCNVKRNAIQCMASNPKCTSVYGSRVHKGNLWRKKSWTVMVMMQKNHVQTGSVYEVGKINL